MQSKGLSRVFSNTSSKASILWCSAFSIVQLSHPYMTTGKTIGLTRWTFRTSLESWVSFQPFPWAQASPVFINPTSSSHRREAGTDIIPDVRAGSCPPGARVSAMQKAKGTSVHKEVMASKSLSFEGERPFLYPTSNGI